MFSTWITIGKGGKKTPEVVPPRQARAVPIAFDGDEFYAKHNLEKWSNIGQGNCALWACAQKWNALNPDKPPITIEEVRAGMAAEMRRYPEKYALSIVGCSGRHNDLDQRPGAPGPVIVNAVKYENYVLKAEKSGWDYDNVEWQATVAAFPQLKGIVFLKKVPTFGGFKLKQAYFGFDESPLSKALAGEITPELLASIPDAIICIYTVPSKGQVSGHFEMTQFKKKDNTAAPIPVQVPAQVCEEEENEKEEEQEEEDDDDDDDDEEVSDDSDDDDSDENDADVKVIPSPAVTTTVSPLITVAPVLAVKAGQKVPKLLVLAPKVQFGKVKSLALAETKKLLVHSAQSFSALFSKPASKDSIAAAAAAAAVTNGPKSERVVTSEMQTLINAMPAMPVKRTQYSNEAVLKGEC